jgi:hypothetical protein
VWDILKMRVSGLNYHLCFTLGECSCTFARCRSVGHTQNVSLDSTISLVLYVVVVVFRPHECREHTQNVSLVALNYHLRCILCSGPQVWCQTWLAPCPYAPYSMNSVTLGYLEATFNNFLVYLEATTFNNFLSVFGSYLQQFLSVFGSYLQQFLS